MCQVSLHAVARHWLEAFLALSADACLIIDRPLQVKAVTMLGRVLWYQVDFGRAEETLRGALPFVDAGVAGPAAVSRPRLPPPVLHTVQEAADSICSAYRSPPAVRVDEPS